MSLPVTVVLASLHCSCRSRRSANACRIRVANRLPLLKKLEECFDSAQHERKISDDFDYFTDQSLITLPAVVRMNAAFEASRKIPLGSSPSLIA